MLIFLNWLKLRGFIHPSALRVIKCQHSSLQWNLFLSLIHVNNHFSGASMSSFHFQPVAPLTQLAGPLCQEFLGIEHYKLK